MQDFTAAIARSLAEYREARGRLISAPPLATMPFADAIAKVDEALKPAAAMQLEQTCGAMWARVEADYQAAMRSIEAATSTPEKDAAQADLESVKREAAKAFHMSKAVLVEDLGPMPGLCSWLSRIHLSDDYNTLAISPEGAPENRIDTSWWAKAPPGQFFWPRWEHLHRPK